MNHAERRTASTVLPFPLGLCPLFPDYSVDFMNIQGSVTDDIPARRYHRERVMRESHEATLSSPIANPKTLGLSPALRTSSTGMSLVFSDPATTTYYV